ncbi:MAG TPA: sulfatase [Vicinamibacteria bacterium]|nr:sulfatase [Vicinamibacteria bacterium]
MARRPGWVAVGTLAAALSACAPPSRPVDLLRPGQARRHADVGGRGQDWIAGQTGKGIRINDVVRATLNASPPSRYEFVADIPKRAFLSFAAGIPPERHDKPGVEFLVKLRQDDGREHTLWTSLLDPLSRPAHRNWMPVQVDLAPYEGRGRTIVFETHGFEKDEDARQAFWGDPGLTVRNEDAPLAIVYLVDTLRADHTSPYGYHRDTTPELTAFARDSVLFEQAIAHASWTKPSVASLFTSLLPGRHRAVQLRDSLDPGLVTLAEMLQTRGFATGAAVANSVIYTAGTNFDQGFDFFAGLHGADDRPSKVVEAGPVVDAALGWIEERRGFPNFLYVHTMDPHVPYTPPPPFDRRYEPRPTPDHPGTDPRFDFKEPLDLERLIAQYDGEIAYGDQEFGRFVRELKARGLYDRALIVFTADHGEEFNDHGKWLHGRSVFDELIRVPLVVKFPGQRGAGRRVAQQVQMVDILPTVLQELGLPVPTPPVITGHPLQAVVAGPTPEPPAVSEISHRGFVAHGMRTGRDKYIRRFSPEEDELYFDLTRDPGETVNLIEQHRERVRLLKAGVEAAMVPNPFRQTVRFEGPGRYEVRFKTGGWIEGVEPVGFGPGDRYDLDGNGRKLLVTANPRPGHPREIAFSLRPQGAPVWLEGARDGRPLAPREVHIAQEGIHPAKVPFKLPEIESEKERTENIFAAPAEPRPGVHVWLTLAPGHQVLRMDKETCERLKALGYVGGDCPGG